MCILVHIICLEVLDCARQTMFSTGTTFFFLVTVLLTLVTVISSTFPVQVFFFYLAKEMLNLHLHLHLGHLADAFIQSDLQ